MAPPRRAVLDFTPRTLNGRPKSQFAILSRIGRGVSPYPPSRFANFPLRGRSGLPPHLSTLKFGKCEFVSCRGRPHNYLVGPVRILHARGTAFSSPVAEGAWEEGEKGEKEEGLRGRSWV